MIDDDELLDRSIDLDALTDRQVLLLKQRMYITEEAYKEATPFLNEVRDDVQALQEKLRNRPTSQYNTVKLDNCLFEIWQTLIDLDRKISVLIEPNSIIASLSEHRDQE